MAGGEIAAAYQRRASRSGSDAVRFDWFIQEVSNKIALTMEQRVKLATDHLLSRVVRNVSVPVVKEIGKRSGRIVVTQRSKAGEFPRADTTQLLKTTFMDTKSVQGMAEGYVGTPLDYGLILEVAMDRSFLVRTLREEEDTILRILTEPIA